MVSGDRALQSDLMLARVRRRGRPSRVIFPSHETSPVDSCARRHPSDDVYDQGSIVYAKARLGTETQSARRDSKPKRRHFVSFRRKEPRKKDALRLRDRSKERWGKKRRDDAGGSRTIFFLGKQGKKFGAKVFFRFCRHPRSRRAPCYPLQHLDARRRPCQHQNPR